MSTDISNLHSVGIKPLQAGRWEFLWLCGLILAFCYERPLASLTEYDRLNPRLFDVLFAVGIVVAMSHRRKNAHLSRTFRLWRYLVLWFCLCAGVWALFLLPFEYGRFSLFFAAEYLIGLGAIYLAARMQLSAHQKKSVIICAVFGGIFVAAYCIPEYLREGTEIKITSEKTITVAAGTLFGPLGSTYFHLAQYQTLAFCLACSMASMARKIALRMGWMLIALFIAWPLFFSGSRTALGLLACSVVMLFVLNKKLRRMFAAGGVLFLAVAAFTGRGVFSKAFAAGLTGRRIEALWGSEAGENGIKSRLLSFNRLEFRVYKWHGLSMPFIGSGFYVAPVYDSWGDATYRVGFGVHNIYLFPLEQAGLVGLLLFILFLVSASKGLFRQRHTGARVDRAMATAIFSFLAAVLVVGLAGQIFWRGFGTENFNTYVVIMILLAIKPVIASECAAAVLPAGTEAAAPP